MKKKTNKQNEKEYGHIAVDKELKFRFEKLRFSLMGRLKKNVTHEYLLNILLDDYERNKKWINQKETF